MTSSALAIAPPADDPSPEPVRWSLPHRIAFRFLVVFSAIYLFPWPLNLLPKTDPVVEAISNGWNAFNVWVARDVLGLAVAPESIAFNGSGDRLIDWVNLAVLLFVAAVGAAVWSVIDRRRLSYPRLAVWVRVAIRYFLAITMMSYGFAKIFKTQFPFPSGGDLAQPLGDGSPMGLLWNFMGYSTPYNWFTGGAEVLGGVLLFSRRTTTLGALVIIGVMSNVVMLNFCYDVPVKIFSVELLAAAVLLAARDLRRLADLLVFNRPTPAADLGPRLSRRSLAVKIAVIALALYSELDDSWESYHKWGPGKPQPALAGVWEVKSMKRNGADVPPLETDEYRWRRLTVTSWGVGVKGMDDSRAAWHQMKFDEPSSTLTLSDGKDQVQPWVLHVARDDDELRLEGFYDSAPVEIVLKKREFLLETRGFHWVNDFPYNR
jgi:hypothetical protein